MGVGVKGGVVSIRFRVSVRVRLWSEVSTGTDLIIGDGMHDADGTFADKRTLQCHQLEQHHTHL